MNLDIPARQRVFTTAVTDFVFVLVTLAVFAVLALCASGAEKL